MLSENRLNHIQKMESVLNEASNLMEKMDELQQQWQAMLAAIRELENYYQTQWLDDYEASNQGQIPPEMPCGVLSQDAVYNFFSAHRQVALDWIKLAVNSMENTE